MSPNKTMMAATQYAEAFSRLTPEGLDRLVDLVAEDITFSDPFNTVRGKDGFRRIFSHMFETCHEQRFTVSDIACGKEAAYLRWRMTGRLRSWPRSKLDLEGMSEIRINGDGLITSHMDHWDSASQLLNTLPGIRLIIGSILRLFRIQP